MGLRCQSFLSTTTTQGAVQAWQCRPKLIIYSTIVNTAGDAVLYWLVHGFIYS